MPSDSSLNVTPFVVCARGLGESSAPGLVELHSLGVDGGLDTAATSSMDLTLK